MLLAVLCLCFPTQAAVIDWEAGVEGEKLADHLQAVSPPGVTISDNSISPAGGQRGGGQPTSSDSIFVNNASTANSLGVQLINGEISIYFDPPAKQLSFESIDSYIVFTMWDDNRGYPPMTRATGFGAYPTPVDPNPFTWEFTTIDAEAAHYATSISGPLHRLSLTQSSRGPSTIGDIHFTIPEPTTIALLLTALSAIITRRY
ncbi:MAG: PEP-CTERM sorting domain-containing protein [Phycisphaeraceae bacterium]